ncbi:MAG: hypothetical protein H0W83_13905, partial [Planctomycetes bacterium]|nr:hypothetical protein [Planctomycetota bacterium]
MAKRSHLPSLVLGMMIAMLAMLAETPAAAVDAQAAREIPAFDPAAPAMRIATIAKGTDLEIPDEEPTAGMTMVVYVGADGERRTVLCRSADLGLAEETLRVVGPIPTLDEALAAKTDVWGDAAIRQPDGPSYRFFAGLLPPLRYVNAAFRCYPIVLSAPRSPAKARLVGDGSGINSVAAGADPVFSGAGWTEVGTAVAFSIGAEHAPFGAVASDLQGPRYDHGIPIVRMTYRHGGSLVEEEAFAPTDARWAADGAIAVRFTLVAGKRTRITA